MGGGGKEENLGRLHLDLGEKENSGPSEMGNDLKDFVAIWKQKTLWTTTKVMQCFSFVFSTFAFCDYGNAKRQMFSLGDVKH